MIKTRTNFRRLALGFLLVVVSIHVAAQDVNEKSQEPTPVHSVSSDTEGKSGKTIVGYGGLDYYNFDNGGSNLNYWGFTLGAFSYGGGHMPHATHSSLQICMVSVSITSGAKSVQIVLHS